MLATISKFFSSSSAGSRPVAFSPKQDSLYPIVFLALALAGGAVGVIFMPGTYTVSSLAGRAVLASILGMSASISFCHVVQVACQRFRSTAKAPALPGGVVPAGMVAEVEELERRREGISVVLLAIPKHNGYLLPRSYNQLTDDKLNKNLYDYLLLFGVDREVLNRAWGVWDGDAFLGCLSKLKDPIDPAWGCFDYIPEAKTQAGSASTTPILPSLATSPPTEEETVLLRSAFIHLVDQEGGTLRSTTRGSVYPADIAILWMKKEIILDFSVLMDIFRELSDIKMKKNYNS